MHLKGHDIAVCSWSLQPTGMEDLLARVKDLGLEHMQLALGALVQLEPAARRQELKRLRESGIKLTGGMMSFAGEDYSSIERIRQTGGFVPDGDWPLRKRLTLEAAALSGEIGFTTITTHIGFVPLSSDARHATIVARVRELAGGLARHGVTLLMETGQEPAAELLHFLNEIAAPNVHVNFDPANMILYGAGDPMEAIRTLGAHIRHVHVKDATPSDNPGIAWGEEVPFGAGRVGPRRFLDALHQIQYAGPLAIEREAGNTRMADVRQAIQALKNET
jgi:L-ribulose-5-phosphate 3-epimerase